MKPFKSILIAILLISCAQSNKQIDKTYQNKLNATKKYYPFAKWREAYDHGLTQYTQGNCEKAKRIFDNLIDDLASIGEKASEKEKTELFKIAILATNKLDNENDNTLIETEEREELCRLTNEITKACGLDPNKYGNGEGLCSEWREW